MPIVLRDAGYEKSEIRLVKVSRRPDGHDLRDLTVDVALEGEFDAAYDLERLGLENETEIFQATDEPYGPIEGTVERSPR